MRITFFTLFLFLFFFNLNSQGQDYVVKLSEHKLDKPLSNIFIEEVIDLRYDPTNIGFVQKGMSNTRLKANLEGDFTNALHTFLGKNSAGSKNAMPVILKVNKFTITEVTKPEGEFGMAEVAFELLIKSGTGYKQLANVGSYQKIRTQFDITDKHAGNIVQAFNECFAEVRKTDLQEKINNSPLLDDAYLNENSYYTFDKQSIKILAAKAPEKGVYRTFQEFKNNDPGIKEAVAFKKNGTLVYAASGLKVSDCWGFSNGQTAFIKFGDAGNYFPLEKKEHNFVFTGLVSTVDNGAVLMAGLMGGIIGSAVAYSVSEKKEAVSVSLNPITGSVMLMGQENTHADLTKNAKVIIYRNGKNEAPEVLRLYVDEKLVAELAPNSSAELAFKVPIQEIEFCLRTEDNECIKFTPDLDKTSYLECGLSKQEGALPDIRPVSEKEANYYLKIIRLSQKQPKK